MRVFRAADSAPSLPTILAISLILALSGCSRKALPDQASPAAQLYVARCGQCHAAYNPHTMTAEMWRTQVPLMEDKMRQASLPPLSDGDRQQILDYLTAYAGEQ